MTHNDRILFCLRRITGDIRLSPTPTYTFTKMNMDASDVSDLVAEIEKEFEIEIRDHASWQNWGQVMAYVQNLPEKVEVPHAD